jgi:hypothetical protein
MTKCLKNSWFVSIPQKYQCYPLPEKYPIAQYQKSPIPAASFPSAGDPAILLILFCSPSNCGK